MPELCHCGHRLDRHDAVGARYCRATITSGLTRGCICRVADAMDPGPAD